MGDQILISKQAAAKALSISIRKLEYLIAGKEIPVKRIGRRCLVPRRALEEFARRDHPNRIVKPVAEPEQNVTDSENKQKLVMISEAAHL